MSVPLGAGSGSGTPFVPLGAGGDSELVTLGPGTGSGTPTVPLSIGSSSGTPWVPLAKLDPTLRPAAIHAARVSKSAERAKARARAVRGVGPRSIATQMSVHAAERLVREDLVPVLIDTHEAAAASRRIGRMAKNVVALTRTTIAARVPRSALAEVASLAEVKYVEAAARLKPHCDLAHVSARLLVPGSSGRPERGKGVLVGVVDTGIDTSHPAFQNGGSTRLVDYFDQMTGKRYTPAAINRGDARKSPDVVGHGTHVCGIAAGNGGGSPNGIYRGVAPESDLAVVKTTFDSVDIAAGVAHIFQVADSRRQPCVVNLSLGGHFGGHDGTSVVERTLDQLSGKGRMVVVSAGNEGSEQLHASTVLQRSAAGDATRWVANFELRARVVDGRDMGLLWVQVWHQREDEIAIQLRTPNGQLLAPPAGGESEWDQQVFYVHASHEVAPYSGDNCTTFLVSAAAQPRWLGGWSIIASERLAGSGGGAKVGAVHAWILQSEMGRFTSGDTRSYLVGMPGTAFSVITVASYATRAQWNSRDPRFPTVSLDAVNLEDISYFSSPGPTRDGNNKPEIAAPGQSLIAPLSADATQEEMPDWLRLPDIPYAALQGTSMAAPYITGSLALMLEKSPDIDWAEAKRRLILSTRQDPFTTPCWNPRWGYGKMDVDRVLSLEPA